MRTVRIDFTNQSVSYPDGTLAGRRGEHLMTQLIISLPEEMGASEIEYYRLAFCRYGNEERILTNRITEATEGDRAYRSGNLIYCKLWHDLTDAQGLFFNVEGCREKNGEEVLLCKSPRARLSFQSAVSGEESAADTPLSSPRDGITPHIGANGNWFLGSQDTGVSAAGQKGEPGEAGAPGTPGQPGITPHIDSATKHWMTGDTDTGISAEGTPGPHGANGADGVSPTVSVVSNTGTEYRLTITDKNGSITTPNLKGQNGAGSGSVSVTVGETTTGAPGSNATVTNSGTASAPVLNFTIPRGDKGETGPKGEPGIQGPKGDPGPAGANGRDGTDGVSPTVAVASNTSTEYKLPITDKNGSITTPNLKGQNGSGGGSGSSSSFTTQDVPLVWTLDADLKIMYALLDIDRDTFSRILGGYSHAVDDEIACIKVPGAFSPGGQFPLTLYLGQLYGYFPDNSGYSVIADLRNVYADAGGGAAAEVIISLYQDLFQTMRLYILEG